MKFTLQLLFVSSFVSFLTDNWTHPNLKSLLSSTCCNTHSHFKHKYTQLCVCLFLFRGFCHNLPLYLLISVCPLSTFQPSLLQPILPLRAPPLSLILFHKVVLYCIVLMLYLLRLLAVLILSDRASLFRLSVSFFV
jgi:hypothetical protein